MINNKGKPKHKRPAIRDWPRTIVALAFALSALLAPCATADTGIDTASYQGCWDGARAKAAGVNFAFVKLNEGTGYVNPYATCQISTMRANGIREGAYDFASPQTSTPEAEADRFVSEARTRGMIGRAIPVLDWEPSAPGGYWARQTWWALRWVNRVKATWGVTPMIYMSASTISSADWSQVAATDAGLWVAGYPRGYAGERLRNPGAVPYDVGPWPFAAAWQYSSSGSVGGVSGAVDVNWFYGDALTWQKYAGTAADSVPSNTTTTPKNNKTNGMPVADTQTLATLVIRGDYGNDPQRRRLLGSRYAEVMAVVNRRLSGSSGSVAGNNGGAYCVVVSSGDTVSAIAARTGRTPASAWNVPSGNINRIWPGQRICHGGSTTAPAGGTHVVRSGESLWSIYGTGWRAAAQRNGLRYPYTIYPGQYLR
ncbi:GH25 family lysozyme [Bifidobacterium moukalabense]|uniref:GH25 family lysozyme n=1 Tax=Bifidobacterium moukalabense TaxID=1333651 RepID=UPI0014857E86|nr:GH25 family lysozyme [Bifidobacterium moukalabense]